LAYMINVDMETKNVTGGRSNCPSQLHETLGPHFDLTIHAVGCQVHGGRVVSRPPMRYWDDNGGTGYTFDEVVQLARALKAKHLGSHLRRCQKCDVQSHLPDWD
jgi:hypothetical protein